MTDKNKIILDGNCPWCGAAWTQQALNDHYLGCWDPDPTYKPEEQARQRAFNEAIYERGRKLIEEEKKKGTWNPLNLIPNRKKPK